MLDFPQPAWHAIMHFEMHGAFTYGLSVCRANPFQPLRKIDDRDICLKIDNVENFRFSLLIPTLIRKNNISILGYACFL